MKHGTAIQLLRWGFNVAMGIHPKYTGLLEQHNYATGVWDEC